MNPAANTSFRTTPASDAPVRPSAPLRFYRHPISGHCHRVEALLSLLGLPVEVVEVDLPRGEQRTPTFLEKNPWGLVPVLEDGDVRLSESNAILVYLALQYDPSEQWLPRDARNAALVMHWLSLASGPLARGPAAARIHRLVGRPVNMEEARAIGEKLFSIVEEHLARTPFLVGERPTIADLAFYAYTARAPEGDISLAPYDRVRAWLERIEALPGFAPMMRATPLA